MRGSQDGAYGVTVDICDVASKRFTYPADNSWKRFSFSVNVTNYGDGSEFDFVDFQDLNWAEYYIKNIKIERGNKATDWTPAPEDEQYRFSYIKRQIKVGSTNKLHYYDSVLNEISEITATNVEEICEPILEPQLVQFVNRYGGLDFIWFFKMRTDSISTERYRDWENEYWFCE